VRVYFKEKCRYNSWKIKEKPMPRGERVGFKVASLFSLGLWLFLLRSLFSSP